MQNRKIDTQKIEGPQGAGLHIQVAYPSAGRHGRPQALPAAKPWIDGELVYTELVYTACMAFRRTP